MSFGTRRGDLPPIRAMRDIPNGDRAVVVKCPTHRDQVIAVMTETHFVTAVEEVEAKGATAPLVSVCGKCPMSGFEYLLAPDRIRQARRESPKRPVVVTATQVASAR